MSLISYSALATKLRAMKGHLITSDEWRQMSELSSVSDAAGFLLRYPSYRELFDGVDLQSMHRSDIEKLLLVSKYRDYSNLYRFADIKQRAFLTTYFRHYELTLIKRALRDCMDHKTLDIDMDSIADFFKRHSHIDIDALCQASDIPSLISALGSDEYAMILSSHYEKSNSTLFDYELALDQLYFKHLWTDIHTFLSAQESADIRACLGTRIDTLNLQWIYRSKKYYHLNPEHIYALLIPYSYKLKTSDVKLLVEADNTDDYLSQISQSHYGQLSSKLFTQTPDPQTLQEALLDRVYTQSAKRHPYSASCINTYLYLKEEEIERIISVIESIRYSLSSEEILNDILRIKSRRGVS